MKMKVKDKTVTETIKWVSTSKQELVAGRLTYVDTTNHLKKNLGEKFGTYS